MKIGIIGGGAAGLMAAATIVGLDPQVEVLIIEKNDSLGQKVIISGGGRCNLTTGLQDVRQVLAKYPRGAKFLNSAMRQFSPADVYRWFEGHGIPLKAEADGRVFPQSNDGHDVVRVFEKLFARGKVKVMFNSQVTGIAKVDGGFAIQTKDQKSPLLVDKAILTTGGQAYRQTGSTGDGYALASSLGHTITRLAPSLSSLLTQETWPAEISGVSLPSISFGLPGQKIPLTSGPLLFTHFGITGPSVFALSSLLAYEEFGVQHPMAISLDLFPERKAETLAKFVFQQIQKYPKKSLVNVLSALVPKSLSVVFCREFRLDGEAPAVNFGKQEAAKIAHDLKSVRLNIIGRRAGDEFVTAGGVDLKEVNPSTMESKIRPGLYFAGEILDIDGFTGGFNLQSAWATGHLAGESAVR